MKKLLTTLICAAALFLPTQAQPSSEVVESFSVGEWQIRFGGKTHYHGQVGETAFDGYWNYSGEGTMSVFRNGAVRGEGAVTTRASGGVQAQTAEGPGTGNFQMEALMQMTGDARGPTLQGTSSFGGVATVKSSESVHEAGPTALTVLKIKTATSDRVTGVCTAADVSRRATTLAPQMGFQVDGEMEFEAVRTSQYPLRGERDPRYYSDHDQSFFDAYGEEGHKWRDFKWHRDDFPGTNKYNPKRGPNEAKAREMIDWLDDQVPERRPNTGPHHLDKAKFFDRTDHLRRVHRQGWHRLNREAAEAFEAMAKAAAADGVDLKIASSFRSKEEAAKLAAANSNRGAVADPNNSAHTYGVAIDFDMMSGAPQHDIDHRNLINTTRNYPTHTMLRRTPTYKWLAERGAEFGFYPFHYEPWHWEYNPPDFNDFRSGMP